MEFKKENIILDTVNCLAIMKIDLDEIEGDNLFIKNLGNYKEVPKGELKMKIIEFENFDETIVYYTDKTEISTEFIDKAKEICKVMGWDWDFRIFENDEPDYPMIFVNGYDIGFVIAPRDRNWFHGKSISEGFKSLDKNKPEEVKDR